MGTQGYGPIFSPRLDLRSALMYGLSTISQCT